MKIERSVDFDGSDYIRADDQQRLTNQIYRIFNVLSDGNWHTKSEIAARTGDSEASILAQFGNMRKKRFGAYAVEKRPRGDRKNGLYEYRLGERGAHVPRKSPLLARLKDAEAEVDRLNEVVEALTTALESVDPNNPALRE